MIPYLFEFIPKVTSYFVLFDETFTDVVFETCTSTKPNIKKSDKYDRLFYEEENNPTKFVYDYNNNKMNKLWDKLC